MCPQGFWCFLKYKFVGDAMPIFTETFIGKSKCFRDEQNDS